jgi:hydroxymethylpyrimidine pyrophosphatase-like HAD family hydrolase
MLEYAGIGVAMGNAIPEAKAAADQICGTNDEDGIARWLEANVL